MCGTATSTASGWISIGGPIKGAYVVKSGSDIVHDYISDFGVYVDDACQAVDNKANILMSPTHKTVKDFKYHSGTDSQFWLSNLC